MEKSHFSQAKLWLKAAEYISTEEDIQRYPVGLAMLIHSIMKANDALCIKFLHSTARRHDDARRLYEECIRKNFIKPEYASYSQIIQDAINLKAQCEYRGGFFSKKDFDGMQRKAERFLQLAEKTI